MSSKSKTKKKVGFIIFLSVVIVILLAFLFAFRFYLDKTKAVSNESETVFFTINEGDYMSDVIDKL